MTAKADAPEGTPVVSKGATRSTQPSNMKGRSWTWKEPEPIPMPTDYRTWAEHRSHRIAKVARALPNQTANPEGVAGTAQAVDNLSVTLKSGLIRILIYK